jgi:acyl carrier protein
MDEVLARVQAAIAKSSRIPLASVTVDSTFEDLGMDSLDRVNLLFALEEEFCISIPDEGMKQNMSVREVATGISTLLSGNAASAAAPGRS